MGNSISLKAPKITGAGSEYSRCLSPLFWGLLMLTAESAENAHTQPAHTADDKQDRGNHSTNLACVRILLALAVHAAGSHGAQVIVGHDPGHRSQDGSETKEAHDPQSQDHGSAVRFLVAADAPPPPPRFVVLVRRLLLIIVLRRPRHAPPRGRCFLVPLFVRLRRREPRGQGQ